jgi:membrane protein required for colicin V production
MAIDAFFLLLMIFACIKGYQKGLIIALFSIIAFIAGLAAALKLSAIVAAKLSASTNVSAKWLPVISFVLVFLIVVLLVNLGAKMLQKSVELVMLGWVNRIGGIIFYALLYSIVLSIFLFYAVQLHLIKNDTITTSGCYSFIKPLGPGIIDKLGIIIPFFKDMFSQLQHFFDAVSNKI